MLSIISDPSIEYPGDADFYAPDAPYPEYRYPRFLSRQKNRVYQAVRECFIQAGLDREHLGQASWNPLGRFIHPGSRVFVLSNFVLHRGPGESVESFRAKCLHGSVLRAMLDYVLIALGDNGSAAFGNAPMQACRWEDVIRETGAAVVEQFYQTVGAPVQARDLRLLVNEKNALGAVTHLERRSEADGVAVNLGEDSMLARLDQSPPARYRVMNYNPLRTEAFHTHGAHTYVFNRAILEADTIVSLPKMKTHEKVGITCALKGFVGAVGHKDSLPHHRYGTPGMGGDEYPTDGLGLLRAASAVHERVMRVAPDQTAGSALRVADQFIRKAAEKVEPINEGAWWGNDTAWRMVLDLARIARYASALGEMQPAPQRNHLILVDGITAGEGEGPLFPKPFHSGTLILSDNLFAADIACASLMGYDPECIPMLREARRVSVYPLADHRIDNEPVLYNGAPSALRELRGMARHHFEPPPGWIGKL